VPGLGETVLGLMREALHRLPPAVIQRSARRFVHDPGGVDRVVDEAFLAGVREMHATAGYARAYASTVRALADVRAHRPAELLDRLAATRLPVLLIWGEEDRLLPVDRARGAVRRLPGARLEVIEGAGHTPQAERPERFNRALEDFLAS
jgi:pimeloyl-ACP methyl ester carboxylesterase